MYHFHYQSSKKIPYLVQDASSKQQTKQKYKPNHQQTGWLPAHSALTIRRGWGGNLSINLTLYEAYTIHWTKLRGIETKRKKEFNLEAWEKETSNKISWKKIIIIINKQRNTIQIKEQTRNTEVQINEKKIGKIPEKEFRKIIVNMIKKSWKQNGEKSKNQLTKI